MKLHFEPNLDYQLAAIEAVCDLFRGQEIGRTEFTVTTSAVGGARWPGLESDLGIGNRLLLRRDDVQENLARIQLAHGLQPTTLAPGKELQEANFTIEMETGTGKTYVYLRTIFELNRRYGFTKFVIVVPSVAIKEGVYKSLQIMADHFRSLYANVPFEYFLYDSGKLGQVRSFASSAHLQIMVVTVGAINKKDVNNLYKETEKTSGEKPIDLIRATCPILIVDEPQSVDGGLEGNGKEALGRMNSLCTLRYSATHVDQHHMIYRLDAVDAYERKLVKQIEVASASVAGGHNRPYVRFLGIARKGKNLLGAKVELDMIGVGGRVQRREVTVQDGDPLEQTTGRDVYANCRVGEINAQKGNEFVEIRIPGGEHFLKIGQAVGDVEPLTFQRELIRRTIQEHLDKELRLAPQGIKVLSLFFIDTVEKYRSYDADGQPVKGDYAVIFEEEYLRLAQLDEYCSLFKDVDIRTAAAEVHNGYFSIDKKGGWTDTAENNQANRDNAERAYNLIMKDKELLLSFETRLKFIFSHSALKEGWDNPNVFQICALREMGTERERRQTIGRGLRLCVNQHGERVRDSELNTLTVVATEGYEQFAENLQKEFEEDTGIRFGIVEPHQFAAVAVVGADGAGAALGFKQSKVLWEHLRSCGYVAAKGKVQDALRQALKDGALLLPEAFQPQQMQIQAILRKLAGRLKIKNADERRAVKSRQAEPNSDEFQALWDRVQHQTTYRVHFDNEALIATCIKALQSAPPITETRLLWSKADLAIGRSGVGATKTTISMPVELAEAGNELPDLLTDLQDKTQLTRRTLARLLTESGRLSDFQRNPEQFMAMACQAINRAKRTAIVDGIKYQRLDGQPYYAQELYETAELTGYLKSLLPATKCAADHGFFQMCIEQSFANQWEHNEAVKVYAKLPNGFKIPTPLGTYNPDWAVLVETECAERLYFVAAAKGSLLDDDVRERECAKIDCRNDDAPGGQAVIAGEVGLDRASRTLSRRA